VTYRRTAAGLQGQFEIAPPNDHAHFKRNLTWSAHRAG
jgi:hypothetical protein